MKKYILIFLCSIFTNEIFAQKEENGFAAPCPPGYHTIFINYCEGFNFHRKKTDCKTGFGLCFINCTGWHIECLPGFEIFKSHDTDLKERVWGRIVKDKMEMHFPLALAESTDYTEEDLKVFFIDDDEMFFKEEQQDYVLLQGEYPVTRTEIDLVVYINMK